MRISKRVLDLWSGYDLNRELSEYETIMIVAALNDTKGHVANAAKLLKLQRSTLSAKIKKYCIEVK